MGIFSLLGKKEKKEKKEEKEEEVVCEDCGENHKNTEVIAGAAEELTDEIFPEAWKEFKEELKPQSKKEIEIHPKEHSGSENLGRLYFKMRKFELAEQHLKNALELAMKQKEEDPNCIDDEVIDDLRKNLEEVKNAEE